MKSYPARKRALVASLFATAAAVSIVGFSTPGHAFAQPPSTGDAADVADVADAVGELVITGSRIARPEIDYPNPVTTVTAEDILESGRTNLTDFLLQTPALVGSSTSSDNAGSNSGFGTVGINVLNLRNLGTERTLVLVDGRRHVAGLPGSAAVDINTIPVDLIERVDILTGGASAIYGADGVSGVVNFILRKDFEGLAVRAQTGTSQEGDAGSKFVSVTGGKNFADGKGNFALSYEYSKDDRLSSFDRPKSGDPLRSFSLTRNPADFPDTLAVFDRIPTNNTRYADSSRDSAIDIDFDGIPEFTGTGAVYDRGTLLPSSGGLTQGGSSTPTAGYQGDIQPDNLRQSVNFLSSYEFSDAFRIFAQGKFVKTDAFSFSQPTFDFFTFITPENPFIPANIAAVAPDGVLLSRDNFDFGIRGDVVQRQTYRGVVGADGKINDRAKYEVSLVYGQTSTKNNSINDRLSDRYFAALDAVADPITGNPVCRSSLEPAGSDIDPENFGAPATTFVSGPGSACRPLNLFGENVASQEALDFAIVDHLSRSKIDQFVLSASISGDFGDKFAAPAGVVSYAIGAETRRETSQSDPSAYIQNGELLDSSQILPEGGKFTVTEAFGELDVPLLKDAPFAKLLNIGGAVRFSDYSTIGSTRTWQVNSVYAPTDDFRFRGTYSQAVRAPNIAELFGATSGTFEFIDDPCDPTNIGEGSSFRADNCNTILTGFGINPADFSPTSDPEATVSLLGRSGGNPNLTEETARTWTAGVVYNPTYLRALRVSLDWYDILLKNAVNTATAQEVVDLCVDQPTLINQFCSSVGRDPTTGYVNDFLTGPQNVAEFRTAGAELTVNYSFTYKNWGFFDARFVGGYLDELSFIPSVGAEADNDRDEAGARAPRFQASADLTWNMGPLLINYGINWFDNTRRYTTEQIGANPDLSDPKYFFYKEKWEHEIYASYDVNDEVTLYGGVNNLFNEQPAFASSNYPVSAIGRFFYVGAKVNIADVF